MAAAERRDITRVAAQEGYDRAAEDCDAAIENVLTVCVAAFDAPVLSPELPGVALRGTSVG
ncbi:hypothetical protein NGF75_11220 [Dietzia kunjamensis]|uniref:hypothetical protein n=1 Tax=Dietzia kunjamensis TaxID=322509 RepID=UPI002DBD36A5|nr:hypothetical protein [Dietzia kunjamensis]MEB8326549.1 hypothetical protein [Dietzia kunjamensis]